LKVRKSDGGLEEFDIEKIKLVLERISDECHESMNSSDIRIISSSIQQTAEKDYGKVITHEDLRKVVRDTLEQNGFVDIAEAYMRGRAASA